MFTIHYKDAVGIVRSKSWSFDQKKPSLSKKYEIVQLEAKGDDTLMRIALCFSNVPITSRTGICLWKAPWAEFLYDNLV